VSGGTLFPIQPTISLLDVNGFLIDESDVTITMRIAKGPHGGSFGGGIKEVRLQMKHGVADFARNPLMVDLKGDYELIATADDDPDLIECRSGILIVRSGAPVSLVFNTTPGPCILETLMELQEKRAERQRIKQRDQRRRCLLAEEAAAAGTSTSTSTSTNRSSSSSSSSSNNNNNNSGFEGRLIVGGDGASGSDGTSGSSSSSSSSSSSLLALEKEGRRETRLIVQARDAGGNIAERFPVRVRLEICAGPLYSSFQGGAVFVDEEGDGGVVDFSKHPLVPSGGNTHTRIAHAWHTHTHTHSTRTRTNTHTHSTRTRACAM
jgi:hypothetical protein